MSTASCGWCSGVRDTEDAIAEETNAENHIATKQVQTMRAKTERESSAGGRQGPPTLPKLIGYDGEVGNYIEGLNRRGGTGREASQLVIREVSGVTGFSNRHFQFCPCERCERHREEIRRKQQRHGYATTGWGYIVSAYSSADHSPGGRARQDPRDHDRRYLNETGGCLYIDLNHVELCLPETRSAYEHVACWHAGLRILRRALDAANAKMPSGQKIVVLVNNSDGSGNSYGTHMNYLVTRRCWQNVFERKMQYLLFLAAYQISSMVFTGQGKVGSEHHAPAVDYQLSQRADFFEQIVGSQTTHARPIVNSRDEALCGDYSYRRRRTARSDGHPARMHVIFNDATLCHVASLLKSGVMQVILAMIEAERVNRRLILDDPLGAVTTWSHDPSLRSRARMFSGSQITAVELQYQFLEEATRFVGRGGCDGIVPHAQQILDVWAETLALLEARDLSALSRRLDWALKQSVLESVIAENSDLDWKHPAVKRLDHVYSNLDPDEGLYWAYERSGHVERVVEDALVEHFESSPPEDTRAWARAMLARAIGADRIEEMDWDHIRFIEGDEDWSLRHRTIDLSDPLGPGRQSIGDVDTIVESARRNA
jgi:proteasome accessory factor A